MCLNNKLNDVYDIAVEEKNLLSVSIELLSNCNWKCKHCYIPRDKHSILSKEAVFKILDDARNEGAIEVLFTGGEIFLRDDIIEIIRYARENFFIVNLFTNISLVSKEQMDILKELAVNNISCTIFSIDPQIHDEFVGNSGSLQKSLENLNYMNDIGLQVEVKSIVSKDNYLYIEEIQKYCDERNIRFLASPFIFKDKNGDDGVTDLRLNDNELKKCIKHINHSVNFSLLEKSPDDLVCKGISFTTTIESDGEVYTCGLIRKPIGNIHNDSISNIWNNSEFLKYMQNLKNKDLVGCQSCEKSEFCIRCSGVSLSECGSLLEKSELACFVASVRKDNFNAS